MRLLLLLAVPAAAVIILASIVVVNRNDAYLSAKQATSASLVANKVAELDAALGDESISGARLFVDQQKGNQETYDRDQERVDLLLLELQAVLKADQIANRGLMSAVEVIKATLAYRGDVADGHITPLQIADRYAHMRGELIGALSRQAAATPNVSGSADLSRLVALIESRSVHIDERLAVQLGLRYGKWAVGHHSAVVRAIAIQEQLAGDRSLLGLSSQQVRVPEELAEMRERLITEDGVPDYEQAAWLAASDQWILVLDGMVEAESGAS